MRSLLVLPTHIILIGPEYVPAFFALLGNAQNFQLSFHFKNAKLPNAMYLSAGGTFKFRPFWEGMLFVLMLDVAGVFFGYGFAMNKVLIIDDEPQLRKLLAKMVE